MSHETFSGAMQASLVFAARYAHHRDTGAALMVVGAVIAYWDRIDPVTRNQIVRESYDATHNVRDWERLRDFAADQTATAQ